MASSPHKDGWVKLLPPDEFSLENTSHGRRNRLVRVDRDDPRFTEVEQLFVKGWRHRKKARPDIQYIFKVLWPEPALEPFLNHRDRVQSILKAKDKRGNEKLLFHGTNLSKNALCVLSCAAHLMCADVVQRIRLSASDTASIARLVPRADDYVCNLSESTSLRVVILSRVVVGRSYKRYWNAPDLVAPPPGYDSIAGEIGWDLNYEETVTYDNGTMRPAYLIVYGDKPRRASNLRAFVQMIFKTPIAS